MNEKELIENIEKIKQLLTLPDYEKIDAGVDLAVSLEEPKIFEGLLDGCKYDDFLFLRTNISYGESYLNDWLNSLITSSGTLNEYPTGYYVWISLLVNNPLLDPTNIKELNLTNCYLTNLPSNFSKLANLESLHLSNNNFKCIPNEIFELKKLRELYLDWNGIAKIPNEISELSNLSNLILGNNVIDNISDELSTLKLCALDIGNNNLDNFPDSIYNIKSLEMIDYIDYGEKVFGIGLEEEVSIKLKENIPSIEIMQPVGCMDCSENVLRAQDAIERHDGFFCDSHDEQWGNPTFYCECCENNVVPHGYENDSSQPVMGFVPYADVTIESNSDRQTKTILKGEDGILKAKLICELCTPNIPETDKPSYEDAEKYAEEHGIEDWE